MNKEIFRQYDIRGVWGKDLTEEVSGLIGRAFGTLITETLKKERIEVSVGRDVRLSSPAISHSLIRGIISTGVNVVDIGACPTPVQYFSIHHMGLDGGVMVTGSHNPPEYNGFKMSVGTGTIHSEGIQRIREIIGAGSFRQGSGASREYPVIRDYIAHLLSSFSSLSGITVVLDAGNGTAGLCAPEIAEGLGARVIRLYCEPDGRFPNHHPDPVLPENIEKLIQTVRETGADLGIAYDGDADRIGVVDADGEIVWGDRLMIIFSREILRESPGASIIGEVKCSQLLYDDIRRRGGVPVMWKTGHSLIKSKMKETGALIAGEMSGHIFFADRYFGYDDAIYATLRLLEILKKRGGPFRVSEMLGDLPQVFSTPEIRFDCSDTLKFRVVERIRDAFTGYEVNTTDGARIRFSEGWALVRASNTQPALVLRFEAGDEEALARIKFSVEEKLGGIMKELAK